MTARAFARGVDDIAASLRAMTQQIDAALVAAKIRPSPPPVASAPFGDDARPYVPVTSGG